VNLLSSSRSQQASKIPEVFGKFLVEPDPPRRRAGQTNKPRVKSSNGRGKGSSLRELALVKEQELWKTKLAHRPKPFWYPYATLRNLSVLERLLAGASLDLLELCTGAYGRVADIGAADGDLAFFLEELGFSVDVFDNEYTNFNKLAGARILKNALDSSVTIHSIDLDSRSQLFAQIYDAVFLLGTLYHLKNPFYILEKLAQVSRYCFLSTRIARQTADGLPLSKYPVAYLLGPEECNNDSTNFWIFSDEGLKQLLQRTGWSIWAYTAIGDTNNSTPADPKHDERAFCVLKSNAITEISASPNPVPVGEKTGMTTIRWNTAGAGDGKVYVSVDGQRESLFAGGREGVATANWIQAGLTYEFRLYDSSHTRLLDKISVASAIE
jgi:tRNA (mo5U34)-methyltransferase